jgi:hypothetical protein
MALRVGYGKLRIRLEPRGARARALVPPIAGCAWHMKQLVPLKDGPRPRMVGLAVAASVAPFTLATCPKRAIVLNQKPATLPAWRITCPAPSLPFASGGCLVFTTGVGSRGTPAVLTGPANDADWLPTGRGPGSQDVPNGHSATAGAAQLNTSVAAAPRRRHASKDFLLRSFIDFSLSLLMWTDGY